MGLDRIWQLDVTSPTSNSNYQSANIAELCAPSGLNNALRALGSMIAREIAFQAHAISASVSMNICTASSGLLIPVVGSGAVNSLGTVPGEMPSAAVIRFLQFSSSASLSNGTALRLLGGASRRTQPGDIGGYLHAGNSDVWHEFLYSRADGALAADSVSVTTITNRSLSTSAISTVTLSAASISATNQSFTSLNATSISASVGAFGRLNLAGAANVGTVIQTVFVSSQTADSTASNIPNDDSAPLFNEGKQAFSQAFTPKSANSTILVEVSITGGQSTTGNDYTIALFKDASGSDACQACVTQECASNGSLSVHLAWSEAAGSTSARTYAVRYGASSGTAHLNDNAASDGMGGKYISSMKITEFL